MSDSVPAVFPGIDLSPKALAVRKRLDEMLGQIDELREMLRDPNVDADKRYRIGVAIEVTNQAIEAGERLLRHG